MKRRILWIVIAVTAGAALAWWAQQQARTQPRPAVTIQDGKTIDFSSGKPVVKDSPAEKAAIAAAVQEIDEAARGVKFAPTTPPPGNKKPVAPPPAITPPGK